NGNGNGNGGYAVELTGDPDLGPNQLHVVPADDPEIAVPLSAEPVQAVSGQVLAKGGRAYVVSAVPRPQHPSETRVELFDVGPPLHRRGSLGLPFSPSELHYTYAHEEGITAALVDASLLVLHPEHLPSICGETPCRPADAHLYLIDGSLPDAPAVAAKITIPGAGWATLAGLSGHKLLVTHLQDARQWRGDAGPDARFFVTEVDVTDPRTPVLSPAVAIPGLLLTARGDLLYTATFPPGDLHDSRRTTILTVSRRQD